MCLKVVCISFIHRHVQENSRSVRNYEGSGYTKPWCYVKVAAETIDGITRPSYITRQASDLPKCRVILEIERASLLSDSSMFLRFLYLNSYLCVVIKDCCDQIVIFLLLEFIFPRFTKIF